MSAMVDILNKVCEIKKVFPAQVLSPSREKTFSEARTLMWVAMRMYGFSSTTIARFSHRDHATITKMAKLHEDRLSKQAADVLKDLGLIAYKMKMTAKEVRQMNKKFYKPAAEILIERKVPNYQTGEIETIWEKKACEKSSLIENTLKDGALCVKMD